MIRNRVHRGTAAARWPSVRALRMSGRPRTLRMGAQPTRRVMGMALGGLATAAIVGGSIAVVASAAAAVSANDPRQLVTRGMQKFRRGDVEGSLQDFDAAWAAEPRLRPFLWQRGLSQYYAGQYEQGAAQFRSDVAVNPNDTEEAIWTFMCEARTLGVDAARRQFLAVGVDSRPVMRAAYNTFRSGGGPQRIRDAISDADGHSAFYGLLYIGLYEEAHGGLEGNEAAKVAILAACATRYAKASGDYMASLARVHAQRRGWEARGA